MLNTEQHEFYIVDVCVRKREAAGVCAACFGVCCLGNSFHSVKSLYFPLYLLFCQSFAEFLKSSILLRFVINATCPQKAQSELGLSLL